MFWSVVVQQTWHRPWITILLLAFLRPHAADENGVENGCSNSRPTGTRGMITSPNYPLPYNNDTRCEWFINGDEHDIITISFQDLDVPSRYPGRCDSDSYLRIGPKPDMRICGRLKDRVPRVYISERPNVWIKFRGSGRMLGRGFSLHYVRGRQPYREACPVDQFRCDNGKCIMRSWKCNGADECGDHSDEKDCAGGIHRLTTIGPVDCGPQRFGCIDPVTREYTCHRNSELCDGKKDCAEGEDERRCADDNGMCRHELDRPYGYLHSPNFPSSYPPYSDCQWVVHVKYGHRIQLRFVTFMLEDTYDADYVVVYDGGSEKADVIGQYYGRHRPPARIESTSNRLLIHFHSNGVHAGKGFNASYQVKGRCLLTQSPCFHDEEDCFDESERCDGVWDCKVHGGDERGCSPCANELFLCKGSETQCYTESDHCNGVSHCHNNHDEENCTAEQCGPHNATFLCANHRCIYESWRCDGTDDCLDGSDEMHCSRPSVKVITAAVIGSLICGLLLVIALGCTCKLYALRIQEAQSSARHATPISRVAETIYAQRLAPPPYNEAMRTSRPFDEAQQEYMEQLQQQQQQQQLLQQQQPQQQQQQQQQQRTRPPHRSRHSRSASGGRTLSSTGQPGHAYDGPLLALAGSGMGGDGGGGGAGGTGRGGGTEGDVALIDISNLTGGSRHHPGSSIGGGGTVASASSNDDDYDDDSDSTCDAADSSNVNISLATGMSAQWRRGRRKRRPRSSGTEYNAILRAPTSGGGHDPRGGGGGGGVGDDVLNSPTSRCLTSIETASASTDSVVISVDEDNAKVENDVPLLPADPEVPLAISGGGGLLHGRTGSDGESDEEEEEEEEDDDDEDDASDSADLGDTEESVILAEVHSETHPLLER